MSEVELTPEPWAFHLLGLITPLLAISGNILGVLENQAFVAMGVVFVWGVGPILDIVMGESKVARPPRESGTPFEVLLWAHGILQLVVVGTFFWFAANEGLTLWLVVGGLSSGLSAASSAIELKTGKPKTTDRHTSCASATGSAARLGVAQACRPNRVSPLTMQA